MEKVVPAPKVLKNSLHSIERILRDEASESTIRFKFFRELNLVPALDKVRKDYWQDKQAVLSPVFRPSAVGGPGVLIGYQISDIVRAISADYRAIYGDSKTRLKGISIGGMVTSMAVQFAWYSEKNELEIVHSGIPSLLDPRFPRRMKMPTGVQKYGAAALVNYSLEKIIQQEEDITFRPGHILLTPAQARVALESKLVKSSLWRFGNGFMPHQLAADYANLIDSIPGLKDKGYLNPAEIRQAIGNMRGHSNKYWGPALDWLLSAQRPIEF